MPFFFEENVGQANETGKYIAQADGYTVDLNDRGLLVHAGRTPVRIQFSGSTSAQIHALDEMTARTDVFTRGEWFKGVRNYKRLLTENVYPGVDILFRDDSKRLKFDYIIHAVS